jgi:cytoskeleton protein RodZ
MLSAVGGAEDLGRQLRRARQHLGLSLRDVHAVTAIPLGCLAALEEGRLDELPSPVYARGYIRSYAEAVRLDGDRLALELWRLLEEARLQHAPSGGHRPFHAHRPPAPAASPRPATPSRRPRTAVDKVTTAPPMGPVSNLAALRQPESPWVPKPGRVQRLLPILERTAITLLLVVLAVGLWNLERGRPSDHTPRVAAFDTIRPPVTRPGAAPTSPPAPPPPSGLAASSDNGSLAVYPTGKDHFSVVVAATDAPCWIDVRPGAGGGSLFQGTLQPGESRPFAVAAPVRVRVGNLGHATVTADGTPLALPSKPSLPYDLLIQQ